MAETATDTLADTPADTLVWYASYGSNMDATRFGCYLTGGRPPGAARPQRGARDPRPPAEDRAVWLPGGVYFAGTSGLWGGGGVAFYDRDLPGHCPGRAYLVTLEQFTDVAAQEMQRPAEHLVDVAALRRDGALDYGTGGYDRLLSVAPQGGPERVYTFTAPRAAAAATCTAPGPAYLRTLAAGLRDAHRWDPERIAQYLTGLPGAQGVWTVPEVTTLIG